MKQETTRNSYIAKALHAFWQNLVKQSRFKKTDGIARIDIHELLAKRRQIAVVWSIEDVQSVRPDLTDDQAWLVLLDVDRYNDDTIGINWDVVDCHAELLFGDAPETDEAEEE